ncbi:MAG: hypothetical protein KatS3mg031_2546 [Chitinophagales bacterium]|nr:MAG: hypothetical protein KatS3mg031_2546 [Chitinophagales bacterium]
MFSSPHRNTAFDLLGTFFLIWMGCFLLFNLLSAAIIILLHGKDIYTQMDSTLQMARQHPGLIKTLQMILSAGMFGLPPLLLILVSRHVSWSFLRLHRPPEFLQVMLTLVIGVSSGPFVAWALEVNQQVQLPPALESLFRSLQTSQEQLLEMLLVMHTPADLAVNFLMIAIIPAVAEELLFRGALQQLLEKALQNVHVAILLTAAFFSLIHFEFYGFLPRFFMGILLGYLFYFSQNLWLAMAGHLFFNGIQVILLYLYQVGLIQFDINHMQAFPPLVTMISTVFMIGALYLFDRYSQTAGN